MTCDEMVKLLTIVNEEDKRPEAIVKLNDAIHEIYNELEATKKDLKETQTARGELQEQCGRLALRIAAQVNGTEPPKEKTEEELKQESIKFFEQLGGTD